MAGVVVWQLARNPAPEASALRPLLVRLSGRQLKRGTAFTEPALLAGLGILLVRRDVGTPYDIAAIQRLPRLVFPGPYP